MITVIVVTDGRAECLTETLESLKHRVRGPVTARLLIDDSGDVDYAAWLDSECGDSYRVIHHESRRGFCGAIQSAWASLPESTEYVFHVEDDFVFERDVDLAVLADVLARRPHLVQLALRRQAWSPEEKAKGGIVEMWPDEYVDVLWRDHRWLEHRLFWTTNPCLYPKHVTDVGWPDGPGCERAFTERLLEQGWPAFGYWGDRADAPWVRHIGSERKGTGY